MFLGLGNPGFLLFIGICILPMVSSEMRFVCPRPQSSDSGIIEGPCGNSPPLPFEENYMEVSPGPFTIQLEETVLRPGTPIRIALLEWGSNTPPCILLDHIPHRDDATIFQNPNCNVRGYPIGQCYGSSIFLTVDIPDINCERCVLQMINVATDAYTENELPCEQTEPGSNNCTTYYSCSNIRIRPSPQGVNRRLTFCINHQLTLRNKWPYTPAEKYTVNLPAPFTSENYLKIYEKPDWSVSYEMSLSSSNMTVRRGSVALFQGVRPVRFFPAYEGVLKVLTVDEREKLRSGAYSIRITVRHRNGTFQNINVPLEGSQGIYQDFLYRDHSGKYSTGGLLAERHFRGPKATYPQVNFPAGQCHDYGIESYGAVLTLFKSVLPRGIISFTVNRDLFYLHSATSFQLDRIVFATKWNDTDLNPMQQNVAFNRLGTSGLFYEGADFLGEYLNRIGGRRPTEISLVVMKDGQLEVLGGSIEMGIKAIIKNEQTELGLALMTFPQNKQSFNIYLMVSNTSAVLTKGFTISLVAPYVSYVISREVTPVPLDSSMFFYNVSIPIVDMAVAQYLWSGMMSIQIFDPIQNKNHTGTFERLQERICERSENIACKASIPLSDDGGFVERGGEDILPNGRAMIGVNEQQTLMDISITIRDLKKGQRVQSVDLQTNGQSIGAFANTVFEKLMGREKEVFGTILTSVDAVLLNYIKLGRLTLVVKVGSQESRPISIIGRIPAKTAKTPGFSIAQRAMVERRLTTTTTATITPSATTATTTTTGTATTQTTTSRNDDQTLGIRNIWDDEDDEIKDQFGKASSETVDFILMAFSLVLLILQV